MRIRTKICGIRNAQDLEIAVEAGADAIGLICGVTHRSEDALSEQEARRLAATVPPFVTAVLVTHLDEPEEIVRLADAIGVDAIQVHGLVDTAVVKAVGERARRRSIIRAVHVTGPEAIRFAHDAAEVADAILLDSRTPERLGGTGQTHDWSISREIVERLAPAVPVVLAGGLNALNVADAIQQVGPYGVDVNSGVDDPSGEKSVAACTAFIKSATSAAPVRSVERDGQRQQHAGEHRRRREPFGKRDRAHR